MANRRVDCRFMFFCGVLTHSVRYLHFFRKLLADRMQRASLYIAEASQKKFFVQVLLFHVNNRHGICMMTSAGCAPIGDSLIFGDRTLFLDPFIFGNLSFFRLLRDVVPLLFVRDIRLLLIICLVICVGFFPVIPYACLICNISGKRINENLKISFYSCSKGFIENFNWRVFSSQSDPCLSDKLIF